MIKTFLFLFLFIITTLFFGCATNLQITKLAEYNPKINKTLENVEVFFDSPTKKYKSVIKIRIKIAAPKFSSDEATLKDSIPELKSKAVDLGLDGLIIDSYKHTEKKDLELEVYGIIFI